MAVKKKSSKKATKKSVKKPAKKSTKKVISKKISKAVKKATKKTVKKPAKKVTKKAVKKTTKPSKQKSRNLIHAPYEHVFWVCDGMVLRNLQDLANALEHMTEEAYKHHANSERNDFAFWVRDILKEPKLAVALEKSKSKKEALKKVKSKLQRLK